MNIRLINCLGALLFLLPLASVNADASDAHAEFKRKFGNEFLTDMKRYNAELLKQDLDLFKGIFETFQRDFDATPKEKQTFESSLERIKEIRSEIGNTVTADICDKMKSNTRTSTRDLVLLKLRASIEHNEPNERLIMKTLTDNTVTENEFRKIFQEKIYNRYHVLYKNIPSEELAADPEYTNIDRTLERVSKLDTNFSKSGNMDNFKEYLAIFKLVGNFFDDDDYKRC